MYTLKELAQAIKAELSGDPEAVVRRARPFDSAEEGDVTFALDAAYRSRLGESRAAAVIVAPPAPEAPGCNLLIARNPKLAFARAVQALHAAAYTPTGVSADLIVGQGTSLGADLSIHPRVTIGRDCVIGNRVRLHPGVVIGDRCRVGDDAVIYANVSVYDDCEIGSRVTIHAGTVIGADGFGFVADEEGRQVKLLQLGRVRIEDDCEIGANCAIDRGGFGETVLRRGVKLDNFIQVGHNCDIGEDTVVAALTGFSGGTKVGRRCVIAGQVGTNQHITIGDNVTITARTGVTKSVPAGALMGGMMPAQDYNAWRRSQVLYSKLPEIVERLKKLEKIAQGETAGDKRGKSDDRRTD
ncbi:MAG TPA: UDP-3-O-(3-hydroxymyristoyl)glucosamine N-acyltransferase [Blastocatellia bacterium]|nr:UDP-3-O-(3-hydroxymyristoyl)glucosamine N-acyltransferase [Blastocatellia bacterium]